ncbi:MAG: DME family drug/metabolite transporter [Paracoccaceae bacterium]
MGGTFLGGVFAGILGILCAAVLSNSLVLGAYDMGLILFMGAFTIGIGIAFVTWGAPFLPAAEVSLLVLIESVLGPIWVWVFLGEAMSGVELFGGTIVLVSVCLMSLVGKKKRLRSV